MADPDLTLRNAQTSLTFGRTTTGFALADLKRIADSMGQASRAAGVPVITGDTKVVERGKADGVFISTAGIGVTPPGVVLSSDAARPGDVVLVSGTMGDHGVAVMSKRENLEFDVEILSDSAPLHGLAAASVTATFDSGVLRGRGAQAGAAGRSALARVIHEGPSRGAEDARRDKARGTRTLLSVDGAPRRGVRASATQSWRADTSP